MATAYFFNEKLAESDDVKFVEGAVWFPGNSVRWEFLPRVRPDLATFCGWKGHAEMFDVEVGGHVAPGGAVRYPDIFYTARDLEGHVAFRHGVEVRI